MKFKPSRYLLLFLSLVCLCSCDKAPLSEESVAPVAQSKSALLEPTEDFGQEYLDGFVFIGESTTYHLIHRGVLSGGKEPKQVLAPKNGTINLDLGIDTLRVVLPETKQEVTIAQAIAYKRPAFVLLTFGLNGAPRNIQKGEAYFRACYKKLIRTVEEASPSTVILLQSAPPVARNMDMSRYTVDVETLNGYLDTINSWTYRLAEDEGLSYLNSAEVLCDSHGFLKEEYQNGDGHHLTAEAYHKMLEYIRTHGYRKGEKA